MWALGVMIYYLIEGSFNLIKVNIPIKDIIKKT
jgi:hypothetical protein